MIKDIAEGAIINKDLHDVSWQSRAKGKAPQDENLTRVYHHFDTYGFF